MSKFLKQLIFVLIGGAIIVSGVLIIRGATPAGNIKIAGGYQQYGSGKPVAWWKMDEASWNGTAGEVKDSIGTNNGTSSGAITTSTAMFGRAGQFDGTDDYMDIANSDSLKTTSLTFSVWVKNTGNGSGNYNGIVERLGGTTNDNENRILIRDSDKKILMQFAGTTLGTSNTVIPLSTWTHIVFTVNSTNAKLYINGRFDWQYGSGFSVGTGTGSVFIGRGAASANTYNFNGLIDDVRIYNYALTANQVRQIYNETAKLKTNPFLGHDLDLNATYYAQAADNTVHDITTQDISISAWVKVDVGSNSLSEILTKMQDGSHYYELYIQANGTLAFIVADGANASRTNYGIDFRDNKWHYVAGIIDRDSQSNCKLFLDGYSVPVTYDLSDISVIGSLTNTGVLKIGNSAFASRILDGQIRDVKLYYAAGDHWTDAQILYQYRNPFVYTGTAGTTGALTDYWRCDDGSGLTVAGKVNNLTLSSALAWSTQAKAKVSTGLVGYWKMDEASWNGTANEVKDYSGKGNHGTSVGGANTTSTKQIGAMAGSFVPYYHYVGVSHSLLTNMTVSGWVRQNSFDYWQYMAGKGYVETYSRGWDIRRYDTNWIQFRAAKSDHSSYYDAGMYTTPFQLNTWYYLSFTLDQSFMKTYVNGVLIGTISIGPTDLSGDGGFWGPNPLTMIGSGGGDGYASWNGLVDNVKIYNYARTAEQIWNDYNIGLKHQEE